MRAVNMEDLSPDQVNMEDDSPDQVDDGNLGDGADDGWL